MINISQLTKDISSIAQALMGKWERKTVTKGDRTATWVIMGQVAFVQGDESLFPYEVLGWHGDADGHWGILK